MQKILMIAYYFPPVAGGGVQRTSKFVKYLPEFKWKPHVLTVKSGYDYYADNSLVNDISKDVFVFRTFSFEPMKLVRKVVKKMAEYRNVKKGNKIIKQGKIKKYPWLLFIKESIFIPDGEIGWLPFAILKGWRIIKKYNIDLIYSTSCPYTDHLVAYFLKKLTRKPWIADFRDPWSLHLKAPQFTWRKFMDRNLEKLVLRNTNKTISVTKNIVDDFKRIYPAGNYGVIPNGYDEADFSNTRSQNYRIGKFNITYTGIFYKERSPKDFLLAVAELLKEKPELKNDIVIRFVGQLDNPGDADNYNILKSLKLGPVVELIPYVSHKESIRYLSSANVLLLIVDQVKNNEGIMTGKIFEYLRSGKTILALIPPDGVAARVIRETNSGMVIEPASIDQIKTGLWDLYQHHKNATLEGLFKRKEIAKYSRRNLTKMLVKECDDLLHQFRQGGN